MYLLSKIELKMKKAEAIRWSSLEAEDEIQPKPPTKKGKNWLLFNEENSFAQSLPMCIVSCFG